MNPSLTFARHFARLVWLLINEPSNTDEQKGALRALVTMAKQGDVAVTLRQGRLTTHDESLPGILSGVSELVSRLDVHGLSTMAFARDASPADILRLARRLVAAPDPAAPAAQATAAIGASPAPAAEPTAVAPASPTASPAAAASTSPPSDAALPALDLGELLDEQIAAALARSTPVTSKDAIPGAPSRARSTPGGMFAHFASRDSGAAQHELLAQLDAAQDPPRLLRLLEELAARAERVLGDDARSATEILRRVVRRERDVHDLERRRAFVLTVKRLAKPALLKAVVAELARTPETREQDLAVLARAGEDGADALIEQLAAEEGRAERRALFDALVQLQAGIPTLVHMLGDARWYVARNAAVLLGEMRAREAEQPLLGVLHHDDERVRHAATIALMRLETDSTLPTIQQALRDRASQIRMQAATALVGRRERNVTAMLLRALDEERDDEVTATFILVLGRLATPDAVARLIDMAAPQKGLFRKKPPARRIAALQALAEAGTDDAMKGIRALRADKSDEVRASVAQALRRRPRAADGAP